MSGNGKFQPRLVQPASGVDDVVAEAKKAQRSLLRDENAELREAVQSLSRQFQQAALERNHFLTLTKRLLDKLGGRVEFSQDQCNDTSGELKVGPIPGGLSFEVVHAARVVVPE